MSGNVKRLRGSYGSQFNPTEAVKTILKSQITAPAEEPAPEIPSETETLPKIMRD
jgi:hypothetical protein